MTGHFDQQSLSAFKYDLGEAWKQMTGLPFVFAAWISNKKLDAGWVRRFDEANTLGIRSIPELLKESPNREFDLLEYYTRYLSYDLNDEKLKGLDLFLSLLSDQKESTRSYYI